MIVDFHTHTFPPKVAPKALEKLRIASGTDPFTDGTDAMLLESMQAAGIDRSVVLPVATDPLQCDKINRKNAEKQGMRLIFFGAMHPECADWKEELTRLAAMGFRGIKLHPVYQGVDFNDPKYLRILDRAGELGLTVVIHAGDDIGYPGVVRSSPEMIADALRQLGPVRLVAAHMGGWCNWERVVPLLAETGVYLDTAFSLGELQGSESGRFAGSKLSLLTPEAFVHLVRAFGADRILFGTDSPWDDQAAALQRLHALPLTDSEQKAILGGNAERLLGLLPDAAAAENLP